MYSKMIRPNHFSVCDCECNIYRLMNVIAQMCVYIYIYINYCHHHPLSVQQEMKEKWFRKKNSLFIPCSGASWDWSFSIVLGFVCPGTGFWSFSITFNFMMPAGAKSKKKKKGVHDLSNKISSTKKERKKEDRVYHIEIFVPVRTAWLEDWEMSGKRVWSNFRLSFFVLFLSLPL